MQSKPSTDLRTGARPDIVQCPLCERWIKRALLSVVTEVVVNQHTGLGVWRVLGRSYICPKCARPIGGA